MEGVIDAISYKTGGIKLVGNTMWHNPEDSIKGEMTQFKKGDKVNLTYAVGAKKFNAISKDEYVNPSLREIVFGKPDTSNEDRDRRIVRQNVLARATEIVLANARHQDDIDIDLGNIFIIAQEFENWVFR